MSAYTFGDTDLARERLGILAHTFAAPTRALLGELPSGVRRYVLDLGCGPGYTTAILRDVFPHSFVTGIDASVAMIADARARVPSAHFVPGDATMPLHLPAHLVYSRFLLGHLRDPGAALACWSAALLAGGVLVCEEPVRYRSDDALFARYEKAVTAVTTARGTTLWASPALDVPLPGCERVLDRVVEHPVVMSAAAAMFWRNAATWGGDADLIAALQAYERDNDDDVVTWELRQSAWIKNPG